LSAAQEKAKGLPYPSEGVPSLGECSPGSAGRTTRFSWSNPNGVPYLRVVEDERALKDTEPRWGSARRRLCVMATPGFCEPWAMIRKPLGL